jgi:NOL1/NOP2/fmu family ribosome biogenesis protein
VAVTNLAGVRIGRFAAGFFDRVLIDAPCTSVGTLAKSPEAMERWSEKSIGKLATIQSKLLIGAYQALKPGGTLVYSTCTFAPEENEGVISGFLNAHPEVIVEPVELPGLPKASGITEWQGTTYHPEVAKAARIWPGKHRMEGFFICKLRKPDDYPAAEAGKPFADRRFGEVNDDAIEWAEQHFGWAGWEEYPGVTVKEKQAERWAMTPEVAEFDALAIVRRGLRMARTVTGGFKPTTDWCQLVGSQFTKSAVETDGEQTSDYLAGQDLTMPAERGYLVLRHDGITYACGLGQETRIKNQLPTSRRILPRPRIV